MITYGTRSLSNEPLTAYGEVGGEVRTFTVTEEEGRSAGYHHFPKGLALQQAHEWAKAEADRRNAQMKA